MYESAECEESHVAPVNASALSIKASNAFTASFSAALPTARAIPSRTELEQEAHRFPWGYALLRNPRITQSRSVPEPSRIDTSDRCSRDRPIGKTDP